MPTLRILNTRTEGSSLNLQTETSSETLVNLYQTSVVHILDSSAPILLNIFLNPILYISRYR